MLSLKISFIHLYYTISVDLGTGGELNNILLPRDCYYFLLKKVLSK